MNRRSDFLLDMSEGQISAKAALEVAVGFAVLIIMGTCIWAYVLPIGGR